MKTQLKRGVLDMCVLALLEGQDMYGYELVEKIRENIEITEGTIYPLLRRLKDDELVDTYLKESEVGPPRKYYKITESGLEKKEIQVKEYKEFIEKIKNIVEG